MAKKDKGTSEPEVDEHGLVIQKYESMVLVVVPPSGYAEQTLRYARSALFNVHVGTWSVSTDDTGLLRGSLQDEFQVDEALSSSTKMADYSGLILTGGPGSAELAGHPEVQRLAREAFEQGKLVAAWGESVAALASAGVLKKRKLTGDPSLQAAVAAAGGRYSRTQVQVDGHLVTALDDTCGFRFAKALVQIVAI